MGDKLDYRFVVPATATQDGILKKEDYSKLFSGGSNGQVLTWDSGPTWKDLPDMGGESGGIFLGNENQIWKDRSNLSTYWNYGGVGYEYDGQNLTGNPIAFYGYWYGTPVEQETPTLSVKIGPSGATTTIMETDSNSSYTDIFFVIVPVNHFYRIYWNPFGPFTIKLKELS